MSLTSSDYIPVKNSLGVNSFVALKWYWQWLAFSLLALLLYFPVLSNTFLSDDHSVLLKTGVEGALNTDGFFRPLSDITLHLTYRLFALNPLPYYVFQVLLHALNAVLLLQYCRLMLRRSDISTGPESLTAVLAGVFFLCYPFHNEAIVWILGRGSLMAGSLTIISMLVLVSGWKWSAKVWVIAASYFIGMAAYETIIILPIMVAAHMLINRTPAKQAITMILALVISFGLHVWIRVSVSGAFLGGYGQGFFSELNLHKLQNVLKSAGRIFLPPSDDSKAMMISFIPGLLGISIVLLLAWKKTKNETILRRFLISQLACFAIAMLVPVWLGVSTRTSESDRFLYLPSLFFCILPAFVVVYLFKNPKFRVIIVAFFLLVQILLLSENNRNWVKASGAVKHLLREAAITTRGSGRLLIVNLPGETDGAYIFRVGFPEALRLYYYDSSRIKLVSQITRDQQLNLPGGEGRIMELGQGMILIPPATIVMHDEGSPENELLQAASESGNLQQLVDTMINREADWSFSGAARANQIRLAVFRNKLSWQDIKLVNAGKQDKLLIWRKRGWMHMPF